MALVGNIQRTGYQIGEGAAQVFDLPEIKKAIAFSREQAAIDRRQERIAERQRQRQTALDMKEWMKATEAGEYWASNPYYREKVTSAQNEMIQVLDDNWDSISRGDRSMMPDFYKAMAKMEAYVEESNEARKRVMAATKLYSENPGLFSEKRTGFIQKAISGDITTMEADAEMPFWDQADQVDLAQRESDWWTKTGSKLVDKVMKVESSGVRGVAITTESLEDARGNARESLKSELSSDPLWMQTVNASMGDNHNAVDPEEAMERYVDMKVDQYLSAKIQDTVSSKPYTPRKGDDEDKVPQNLISSVKPSVAMAQETKNPDFIVQNLLSGTPTPIEASYNMETDEFDFYEMNESSTGSPYRKKIKSIKTDNAQALYDFVAKAKKIDVNLINEQPTPGDVVVQDQELNEAWKVIENDGSANQFKEFISGVFPTAEVETNWRGKIKYVKIGDRKYQKDNEVDMRKLYTRIRSTMKAEIGESAANDSATDSVEDIKKKYNIQY